MTDKNMPGKIGEAEAMALIQERKAAVDRDWKEYARRPSQPRLRALLGPACVELRAIKNGTVCDVRFLMNLSLFPSGLTASDLEDFKYLVYGEAVKALNAYGIEITLGGHISGALASQTLKNTAATQAAKFVADWNAQPSAAFETQGPLNAGALRDLIVGWVTLFSFSIFSGRQSAVDHGFSRWDERKHIVKGETLVFALRALDPNGVYVDELPVNHVIGSSKVEQ